MAYFLRNSSALVSLPVSINLTSTTSTTTLRQATARCAAYHTSLLSVAGHSKWSKIARGKGALDAERSLKFSKLAAALAAAVRAGGPDPNTNMRLSTAIAQAKAASLPKDVIERALQSKSKEEMTEVSFEGMGPSSISVMVDCLTDNKKRTTQNIRSIFSKHGGELQATGSVAYNFDIRGQITLALAAGSDEDAVMEAAVSAGATDIEFNGEGGATVTCDAGNLLGVRKRLVEALGGPAVTSAELLRIPLSVVDVPEGEQEEVLASFLWRLEEHEDVLTVTHNAAG